MRNPHVKPVVDEIESTWRTDYCGDHDHTGLPGDYASSYLQALVSEVRENADDDLTLAQLRETAASYARQVSADYAHVAEHMEAQDDA